MMKNLMKLVSVLVLFIISLSVATAAQITAIQEVKIDGDVLCAVGDASCTQPNVLGLEKDDEFKVKVQLRSIVALDDVQVEAFIRGFDSNDLIEDISDVFDAKANVTYYKTLTLKLPLRMDQDTYKLRVIVSDRDNTENVENYELEIDSVRHGLEIRDVIISPESTVKAGRALLVSARIKNRGESSEEDVKVKVSIHELGISASDYIDEIDEEDCTSDDCDDSVTSEELYLRIPDNARTGDYTLQVQVEFDDGDETETKTSTIHVVGVDEQPVETEVTKTIITIGPESQEVTKGVASVYPITLTNAGTNSRTYTIMVDSADWATFKISPSNVVVLNPSESKAVYVYATAAATASAGEHIFSVTVKSGDKELKQVALKADVKGSEAAAATGWSKVKKALEWGLGILVVLIVILGLIIGFNKLKGEDEEEKDESQTYY
jgi:uncharacterized membrane protein